MSEFRDLTHGRTAGELARELGVSVRTVRRWRAGAPVPGAILELLRWRALGAIPAPGWEGWRIEGRALVCPHTGRRFTPADLAQLHWLQQMTGWRLASGRYALARAGVDPDPSPAPANAPAARQRSRSGAPRG